MSYSDIKITQADINENNVRSASDILIGNADDNKAVFDKLPEFIAGKHNDLVDALDEVSEHAQGDTEEIDRLSAEKVNVPKNGTDLDYGEAGQMLTTRGNGQTQWEDAGQPTDEQTQNAINNWLDAHPEATTTVQDGSITEAKLQTSLFDKINNVSKNVVFTSSFSRVENEVDDTAKMQRCVDYAIANEISNICVDEYLLINDSVYIFTNYANNCLPLNIYGVENGVSAYYSYGDHRRASGFHTNANKSFSMFIVGIPKNESDYVFTGIMRDISMANLVFINDTYDTTTNLFGGNPTYLNVFRCSLSLKNIFMFGAEYGYYEERTSSKTINGKTVSNYCEYYKLENIEFVKTIISAIYTYRSDACSLTNIRIINSQASSTIGVDLYLAKAFVLKHLIAGQGTSNDFTLVKAVASDLLIDDIYCERLTAIDGTGGHVIEAQNSLIHVLSATIVFDKQYFAVLNRDSKVIVDSLVASELTQSLNVFNNTHLSALADIKSFNGNKTINIANSGNGLTSLQGMIPARIAINSDGTASITNMLTTKRFDGLFNLSAANNREYFTFKDGYSTRMIIVTAVIGKSNYADHVVVEDASTLAFYLNGAGANVSSFDSAVVVRANVIIY